MSDPLKITIELSQEAFTDALRAHVGQGLRQDGTKKLTPDELSRCTDIDLRTIRSYLGGDSAPPLSKFLRIAAALPPSFANAVLEIAGLSGAGCLRHEAGSLDVLSNAAGASAMIAEHLRDGHLDHQELAAQEPIIRQLHEVTGQWLNRHAVPPVLRVINGGARE